jgi:predicted membrane protein
MKYILRILAAPFVFVIFFISFTYLAFKFTANWIRFGGEMIAHHKDDKKTIYDIYEKLKEDSK